MSNACRELLSPPLRPPAPFSICTCTRITTCIVEPKQMRHAGWMGAVHSQEAVAAAHFSCTL
eukprot:833126-Pelagomonas_calceolata.AAC.6